MGKNTRDPEQLYRIDGKNVFCEVMASGLGIDKVCINFVEYNVAGQRGSRIKNSIGFYMPVYTAKRSNGQGSQKKGCGGRPAVCQSRVRTNWWHPVEVRQRRYSGCPVFHNYPGRISAVDFVCKTGDWP